MYCLYLLEIYTNYCLFAYCGVPTHNVLCFCFVCLRLVYPMLPVYLDCSYLIVLSVFSNVYVKHLVSTSNINDM